MFITWPYYEDGQLQQGNASRSKHWSITRNQNFILPSHRLNKQKEALGCWKGTWVGPFCPGSQTSSSRWTWGGGARRTSCWCPRWTAGVDPRTRPDPVRWVAAERSHPDGNRHVTHSFHSSWKNIYPLQVHQIGFGVKMTHFHYDSVSETAFNVSVCHSNTRQNNRETRTMMIYQGLKVTHTNRPNAG